MTGDEGGKAGSRYAIQYRAGREIWYLVSLAVVNVAEAPGFSVEKLVDTPSKQAYILLRRRRRSKILT